MMTKRTVAIIGSGPAGLLACHAAVISGWDPYMLSPDRKPPRRAGAQYLHSYIPECDMPAPFRLKYEYHGTAEGYTRKIYGDAVSWQQTSWKLFNEEAIAWNLDSVLSWLWNQYGGLLVEKTVRPEDLPGLVDRFDAVINTAPLHSIAPLGEYWTEHIWVAPAGNHGVAANTIVYYGDDRPEYRRSFICGYGQVEYPDSPEPPDPNAIHIAKPLRARARVQGVHLIGRYGKWKKGILVDQAFKDAMEIFDGKLKWHLTQAI